MIKDNNKALEYVTLQDLFKDVSDAVNAVRLIDRSSHIVMFSHPDDRESVLNLIEKKGNQVIYVKDKTVDSKLCVADVLIKAKPSLNMSASDWFDYLRIIVESGARICQVNTHMGFVEIHIEIKDTLDRFLASCKNEPLQGYGWTFDGDHLVLSRGMAIPKSLNILDFGEPVEEDGYYKLEVLLYGQV